MISPSCSRRRSCATSVCSRLCVFFFFQAEDGIRDYKVTGVQTCALPIFNRAPVRDAELCICTLAPEKRCYWRQGISYVYDDLRSPMFRSENFDTIVSISTIEHIGLDNTLLYTADRTKKEDDDSGFRAAVREFRRIIRPGGICLI